MTEGRRCRVRVPCSTSNLGSGFDTLGLALDRYLVAEFIPGAGPLRIERTGSLAQLDVEPEADALRTAFTGTLAEAGIAPCGLLRADSQIPIGRGLGSSAAALLAGHDLARQVLDAPSDQALSFRFACDREGHGDNAGPCAFGGLRAIVPGPDGPLALALDLSVEVGFAFAAPPAAISTSAARAALPRQVGHDVATRTLGRLVAMVRGLALADRELICAGIEDELHLPHRLPLIPGAYNALGAGYDAGAWGVTISGSGSGLIALCAKQDAAAVAQAMRDVFAAGGDGEGCVAFAVEPDLRGLSRES